MNQHTTAIQMMEFHASNLWGQIVILLQVICAQPILI